MLSKRLLVDLAPLRTSRDFRRLWLGSTLSAVGTQMTTFAVALQVYLLTHSSAAVGAVGLATAVPGIAVGLLGGSVVDAVDRRRLVIVMTTLAALLSAALAAQAFADLARVGLLYALVAGESMVGAINAPARQTFVPRLLPADQLPAGAALTMLAAHTSLVAGPALAGLVTAAGGLRFCYLIDAVSFLGAGYGVVRLPAMRPEGGAARPGLRAVADGLRFLQRSKVVCGALLTDLNATVLAMPVALFPAINADRFSGSPRTLGLLTTSLGIGGVIGSALSGPVGRIQRQGRGMLAASAAWGVALAGFGLVHGLAASVTLLAVASIADVSSVVLRTTIVQVATPDGYRGRIGAVNYVVGAVCPQVGNARAGAVASLSTPTISAVSGGLGCVAGAAVLGLTLPALVRYRAPAAEPAVQASAA